MKKRIHFRRIPDYIHQEVSTAKTQYLSVVSFIPTTKESIKNGIFKKFGIVYSGGSLICPNILKPGMMNGTYARRNVFGYDIIHRDKPKIPKTISWDVPNFGDPDKGYHEISRKLMVYQRTHIPARDWDISLNVENQDGDRALITAKLITPLDKDNERFNEDLFFAINLMQEQFSDCHALDSELSDEEIRRITVVDWDIFPPGTIDGFIEKAVNRIKEPSPEKVESFKQRTNILKQLNPVEYILGSGMNSRYFGAKFAENVVVFENLEYGNAIYILSDNWKEISRMSRIDILRKHENEYIRILHNKGWEKNLIKTIDELTKKK